jgi:hypothetical protein
VCAYYLLVLLLCLIPCTLSITYTIANIYIYMYLYTHHQCTHMLVCVHMLSDDHAEFHLIIMLFKIAVLKDHPDGMILALLLLYE